MNANFQFAEKHLSGSSTSMLNITSTEMNDMRKTFATKVMLFEGEFTKLYCLKVGLPNTFSQSFNRTEQR